MVLSLPECWGYRQELLLPPAFDMGAGSELMCAQQALYQMLSQLPSPVLGIFKYPNNDLCIYKVAHGCLLEGEFNSSTPIWLNYCSNGAFYKKGQGGHTTSHLATGIS